MERNMILERRRFESLSSFKISVNLIIILVAGVKSLTSMVWDLGPLPVSLRRLQPRWVLTLFIFGSSSLFPAGQGKQARHSDKERAEDWRQHQEDPHEVPGQERPQSLEENDGKVSKSHVLATYICNLCPFHIHIRTKTVDTEGDKKMRFFVSLWNLKVQYDEWCWHLECMFPFIRPTRSKSDARRRRRRSEPGGRVGWAPGAAPAVKTAV